MSTAATKMPRGPTEEELATRARIAALSKETRDTFLSAPDPSNPTHKRLTAILAGVDDLATKLETATTIADFRVCEKAANAVWEIAQMIELADPMGQMFLTDCRNYCQYAQDALLTDDAEDFKLQHSWAKDALRNFKLGIF